MTAPCPAITMALLDLDQHWEPPSPDGHVVFHGMLHDAFAAACCASGVLHAHGWRHPHVLPVHHLRTMLLAESRMPGH